MNNVRFLSFWGNIFGVWGVAIGLNLVRQIPFSLLQPGYLALVVVMICFFWVAVGMFLRADRLKKEKSLIETDEMSMKIGHTALAATTQGMSIVLLILLLGNDFLWFLEYISAQDAVLGVLILMGVMLAGARLYYKKHPEKIWF